MKRAILYGAGNIGRGFIGQLFSLSGYSIGFIDVNEKVISRLNASHSYNIYVAEDGEYKTHTIEHVYGINGKDTDAVALEIASADIMATAVGVNVLKFVAEPISKGIKMRMRNSIEAPLNIIICENMIAADKYLAELIKSYLDDSEKAYFDKYIGLVEPSIGRMVPATPAHIAQKDPLAVCVEPYCQLPVDKEAFKGEIPQIVNMIPFSPFDFYIRRKLYMHNMSHALTAYLGALKGYEYIWQANGDYDIRSVARDALEEISRAMAKEYRMSYSELEMFSYDLILRYDNKLLGDTVARVGKDTKRKLSPSDRFVGAINLCLKHGIAPKNILKGFAAGLLFSPENDEASREVRAYLEANGLEATLKQYCGIKDKLLIAAIENEYSMLNKVKN